jgi:hypothetical protein
MSAHSEAQEALYSAITAAVALASKSTNYLYRATALRDLAAAFRHVEGGPQPEITTVKVTK